MWPGFFTTFTQRTVARANTLRRPRAVPESVIPKNVLAREIADILDDQQLTQTEAAYIMRDAPSQISLVVTGKLRGFSTERLLRMLARLGRDVDIVIRPAKGKTGKVAVIRR
jgi:predicted XRE-type DNA-binding protein